MKGFYKDTVKTSVTKPDLKAKTKDQIKESVENFKKTTNERAANVQINKKYDSTYRAQLTEKLRETNKH